MAQGQSLVSWFFAVFIRYAAKHWVLFFLKGIALGIFAGATGTTGADRNRICVAGAVFVMHTVVGAAGDRSLCRRGTAAVRCTRVNGKAGAASVFFGCAARNVDCIKAAIAFGVVTAFAGTARKSGHRKISFLLVMS